MIVKYIQLLLLFLLPLAFTAKQRATSAVKKSCSSRRCSVIQPSNQILRFRGGFGGGGVVEYDSNDADDVQSVEISGSSALNGIYLQAEDVNGRSHFERLIVDDPRGMKIHLYWSGNQWVLHYDLDPSRNFDNLLAYAKIRVADPLRAGRAYRRVRTPNRRGSAEHESSQDPRVRAARPARPSLARRGLRASSERARLPKRHRSAATRPLAVPV